jgi:hypothetical protein
VTHRGYKATQAKHSRPPQNKFRYTQAPMLACRSYPPITESSLQTLRQLANA